MIRTTNYGGFDVTFDTSSVDRMLDQLALAISPPSLMTWLQSDVSDKFSDDVSNRFVTEGDAKSGFWKELADPTNDIRIALGFAPESPINERTGELKHFVQTGREYLMGPGSATMKIPGDPPDPITAQKLATAQQGTLKNPIDQFGATDARPVLAVDETDLAQIMGMLAQHIFIFVAAI